MSRFVEDSRALPGEGDKVLVAGLGTSGVAAARAVAKMGANVAVCDDALDDVTRMHADQSGADEIALGGMTPSLVDGRDLVVVSPGIRPSHPLLQAAMDSGIPVWSEVELGWRMTSTPLLGVTGTNGKTTTTEMITAILRQSGLRAVSAGNIGLPLVSACEQQLDAIVCELSSFQLHWIDSLRVRAGALLNVAPDHLDWHGTFEAYAADKARIFENQSAEDFAIVLSTCQTMVNTKGTIVCYAADHMEDAGVQDGQIVVPQGVVLPISKLRVRGSAMIADAIAAAATACAFAATPESAAQALEGFQAAPHRMETITVEGQITFINDSKATNPHAAAAALAGLRDVILIAGGRNKGLDLSVLGDSPGVKAVVALGESAKEIEAAFAHRAIPSEHASSMRDAVDRAVGMARPGDTVLLAPACASFDMFDDYKHRGDAFRTAVRSITKSKADNGGSR